MDDNLGGDLDPVRLPMSAGWKLQSVYPGTLDIELNAARESKYRRVMMRLHQVIEDNPDRMRQAWDRFRKSKCYRVPDRLKCAVTYVSDRRDAYYIEAMHTYLALPFELRTMGGMPLLADSLQSRPFHRFVHRHYHFYEQYCRKEHGMWIPSQEFHPEVTGFNIVDLWSE